MGSAGGRRGARSRGGRAVALALALAAGLACAIPAGPALAAWHADGSGTGAATTGTLDAPTNVTVAATSDAAVAVSWSRVAADPVSYSVVRDDGSTTEAACGTTATVRIATTSCVDSGVAPGSYTYRVTAVHRSWTARSGPSGTVVVAAPYAGPLLGAAAAFAVLGNTAITSTGSTVVSGDIGVTPSGTVSGFPPGIVGGEIHVADPTAAAGRTAMIAAYDDAAARTADRGFAGDQSGAVFHPGVYRTDAAFLLTGDMTLDGDGDPGAIFIFQVNAALSPAAGSRVLLVNGATAANVFWQVVGAVSTGANSSFSGTVMTQGALTLGAGAGLIGRALALGAVTLGGNTIRFTVGPAPAVAIDGGATTLTRDTTPTVTGTTGAAVGRPVTVALGGQTLSTTVQTGGTWSVTAGALAAGSYVVVVRVRDAAGNASSASQGMTVEVSPAALALGVATSYSVLSGAAVVGDGTSTVSGDLGVSPGSAVTGFPPGTVGGTQHAGDAPAAAAMSAFLSALSDGESRPPHTQFAGGDLSGMVFHTGVHHTTVAVSLATAVTLDAQGDPDAVFIFQIGAAFSTAASSHVLLVGGAQASNVYWVVQGAASTGAGATLQGTVLSRGAISLGASTHLTGRALAVGVVTVGATTIIDGVTAGP